MDNFLEHNPEALRHTTSLGNPEDTNSAVLVLTATTAELQKFIVKHLDDTNMFAPFNEMKRAGR
jgi:hypothetical protein